MHSSLNNKHPQKAQECLGNAMPMGVKHYLKSGKLHKGGLHKMSNGTLHTGAKHTASSERLYHYGQLSKKAKEVARKSWKK